MKQEQVTLQQLLIIDDEPDLLLGLKRLLQPYLQHVQILTAESPQSALKLMEKETMDVVLSDIRMPGMDGMTLLNTLKDRESSPTVVLMTAYGTIDLAIDALKQGAYDFLTKPLDEDRLVHTLQKALERQQLLKKTSFLEKELHQRQGLADTFIGTSPALKKAMDTIALAAKTDVPVLITGESGTGKELAAKALHTWSNRSAYEFVAINCAAMPAELLESELFGHKKGAFTHATADKKGLFEIADKGTLFLDEIGDMPLALQAKLLRVLQDGEIRPIGENRTKKVNVRMIAATNKPIKTMVERDEFRQDLFFRLNVIEIQMPSLREMKEDIPLLAQHFLIQFLKETGLPSKTFSKEVLEQLCSWNWPGNVRELQNMIKRAAILSTGTTIMPNDLQLPARQGCAGGNLNGLVNMQYHEAKETVMRTFTTQYLTHILRSTNCNITLAAKRCGLERQSLQQLIRRYEIKVDEIKNTAN